MIATLERAAAARQGLDVAGLMRAYSTTVVSMASVLSETLVLMAEVAPSREAAASRGFPQTAGILPAVAATGADGIREIRRLLGLTWEEMADLFGVKRRSVHFWASGKGMKPEHAKRLEHLREFAAMVDRGDPQVNHTLLTTAPVGDESPLKLLIAGDFDGAIRGVGGIPQRRGVVKPRRPVRGDPRDMPPPPEALLDALHDPVGPTSGRLLRSKKIRGKRST